MEDFLQNCFEEKGERKEDIIDDDLSRTLARK